MASMTNAELLVFHVNRVESLGSVTIDGLERDAKPSDRGSWEWNPDKNLTDALGGFRSIWKELRFGYWQQIGQTWHFHNGYTYDQPIILLYGIKLEARSTKPEDFKMRRSYPAGAGVLWGQSLGHLLVGKAFIQIRWYYSFVWDQVMK